MLSESADPDQDKAVTKSGRMNVIMLISSKAKEAGQKFPKMSTQDHAQLKTLFFNSIIIYSYSKKGYSYRYLFLISEEASLVWRLLTCRRNKIFPDLHTIFTLRLK